MVKSLGFRFQLLPLKLYDFVTRHLCSLPLSFLSPGDRQVTMPIPVELLSGVPSEAQLSLWLLLSPLVSQCQHPSFPGFPCYFYLLGLRP